MSCFPANLYCLSSPSVESFIRVHIELKYSDNFTKMAPLPSSPVGFQTQQAVASANVQISTSTATSSVVFNGKLYVFWNSTGINNTTGICYVSNSDDGNGWSPTTAINQHLSSGTMQVLANTGPTAIVNGSVIWLFWWDTSAGAVVSSTFDGGSSSKWSAPMAVTSGETIADKTSPYAAISEGHMYVFWTSKANGCIRYVKYETTDWDQGNNVVDGSSGNLCIPLANTGPSAIAYGPQLCVFWQGQSTSGGTQSETGPYMATLVHKGSAEATWTNAVQLDSPSYIGGGGLLANSNPSPFVIHNSQGNLRLVLLWNGSGQDGTFYAFTDDDKQLGPNTWTVQDSLSAELPSKQLVKNPSSPNGIEFDGVPYVFFVGVNDQGLWYSNTVINVDDGDFRKVISAISEKKNFTLEITTKAATAFPFFKAEGAKAFPNNPAPTNYGDFVKSLTTYGSSTPDASDGTTIGIFGAVLMALAMKYQLVSSVVGSAYCRFTFVIMAAAK